MFDRLSGPALFFIPGAGFLVQILDLVSLGQSQTVIEQISEQFVIAVPDPLLVQGDQEQVGFFQRLEDLLAVTPVQQMIAEISLKAFQERGLEQEFLDLRSLALKNLFDQVIQDVFIAAGEGLDETSRVFFPAQRDRCHLQAGDPTLGAGGQSGDPILWERGDGFS